MGTPQRPRGTTPSNSISSTILARAAPRSPWCRLVLTPRTPGPLPPFRQKWTSTSLFRLKGSLPEESLGEKRRKEERKDDFLFEDFKVFTFLRRARKKKSTFLLFSFFFFLFHSEYSQFFLYFMKILDLLDLLLIFYLLSFFFLSFCLFVFCLFLFLFFSFFFSVRSVRFSFLFFFFLFSFFFFFLPKPRSTESQKKNNKTTINEVARMGEAS